MRPLSKAIMSTCSKLREFDDLVKDNIRIACGGTNSFISEQDRKYVHFQNKLQNTSWTTDEYRTLMKLGLPDPWQFTSVSDSSSIDAVHNSSSIDAVHNLAFNPLPSISPYDNPSILALMPPPPNFSGVYRGHAGQHMRILNPSEDRNWKAKEEHLTTQYPPYVHVTSTVSKPVSEQKKESPGQIFIQKFGESLTKDLFKNGFASNPASATTSIISAVIEACDSIERSDIEVAIREAMSYIPVISQLELLERVMEIDYAQTMKRIHADTKDYIEQGYTKKAATAMAVFDNDFLGDTCSIAVCTIVENEMGKDFKPKHSLK